MEKTKETVVDPKERFRVLSYNVLAEQYASPERYPYCPSWALSWNYRKQGIIKEISSYDSDVICLQEVESLQYSDFFQVELEKLGYEGIFCPKSRARTMEDWGIVDGCATFYRKSKFSLVKEHFVEYQSIAISRHKEFSEDAFSRLMTKDNIAIVAVLKVKDDGVTTANDSSNESSPSPSPSPSPNTQSKSNHNGSTNGSSGGRQKNRNLLVANTHIHWNPENKVSSKKNIYYIISSIPHLLLYLFYLFISISHLISIILSYLSSYLIIFYVSSMDLIISYHTLIYCLGCQIITSPSINGIHLVHYQR